MLALKTKLLSTTFLPLMVGMGVALAVSGSSDVAAQAQNPCAARKPIAGKAAVNPCAPNPCTPCAAKNPCGAAANPCAAAGATGDRMYTIREGDSLAKVAARAYDNPSLYPMLAAYNGIADPDLILVGQVIRIPVKLPGAGANPCAAQKVAASNPCNPCAATNPCNPCNPCAAKGMAGASDCVVPRLQTAALQNPCAAANPCNPCNPCAAKTPCAANPCNPGAAASPCAAQKTAANPCNPCAAAKAANPCNPCAAKNPCGAAASPCNPCNPCAAAEAVELTEAEASAAYDCIKGTMKAAYTGVLKEAAATSPCNPCAAGKAANPCNPCAAAKAANPCNPCAAKKIVNPCNPCAATKPANPCNPCAAKNPCKPEAAATPCGPVIIQAAAPGVVATIAQEYQGWQRLNTVPYISATHGSRYVNNYPAPEAAQAYGRFEEIGTMPAGGRIAKDSFTVSPDGRIAVGPLFMMEKMADGFNAASHDWRYTMIMPDGTLFGVTGGQGGQNVQFCADCHGIVAAEQDSLYFIPEEYRVSSR